MPYQQHKNGLKSGIYMLRFYDFKCFGGFTGIEFTIQKHDRQIVKKKQKKHINKSITIFNTNKIRINVMQ